MLPAGDFSSTYALGEVLGKGTYAEVFKARAVAPSADGPRAYAVKRVDRQDLKEEDDQGIIDEVKLGTSAAPSASEADGFSVNNVLLLFYRCQSWSCKLCLSFYCLPLVA